MRIAGFFVCLRKSSAMKYLLLLLLTTSSCFAQEFKNDWADFKAPSNWIMEFENDTLPLLGKNPEGIVCFINTDSKLKVLYYIFKVENVDDSFIKKIENWSLVQSCIVKTGSHKPFRSSFESKHYFYTIKPCYNCSISENEDCSKLADAIFKFVSPQSKWTTLDLINEKR